MLSINLNGTMRDVVSAVQKCGFAWALDRDNGSLVWSTEAGPGRLTGGGTWGAATDNKRVYTNIANSDGKNFTLKPSEKNTTAGGWLILAMPPPIGPVTIVNGVLFGGSTHPTGPIYAMDARSGKILWSHNTGATVYGGISVNLGSFTASFTNGTSLFAFCL
ncbi:hypothetical protein PVL29_019270 [Vitis rotundifolia]|uniref:Uncharacterized protein n=1 Tax=Vitis rotundifolia TaxID=103349 RepID=A0AA38Z725_VITRO|nr:hypothetical protein PVL29_019270 [Vitis rotundifolia]